VPATAEPRKSLGLALVLNGKGRILVLVTVTATDDRRSTEKLVLRALIISVLIHFLVFFGYKIGESQGWWAEWSMPRWMQAVTRAMAPTIPIKIAVIPPPQAPLVFVQTDPADAVPQAPKKTIFEAAHNTVAANPKIVKPSDMPDIQGRQTKVLKTTPDAKPKPQPVQPAPQEHPQVLVKAAPQPKTYTPGDLASAKPAEKQQENNNSAAETPAEAQPIPIHHRPRTLAEVRQREGTPGEQTKLAGGVSNVQLTRSSVDAKGTVWGNYEEGMVDAISTQWHNSLDSISWNASGKVVVTFRLYPDGHVEKVNIDQNEVTDELATFCSGAIIKPSPFGPWPRQMRVDIPTDYLLLQFTFYYDLY
jgi:hypothetical protein